eukprot:6089358-Pyramimonas_sp.AAC.1
MGDQSYEIVFFLFLIKLNTSAQVDDVLRRWPEAEAAATLAALPTHHAANTLIEADATSGGGGSRAVAMLRLLLRLHPEAAARLMAALPLLSLELLGGETEPEQARVLQVSDPAQCSVIVVSLKGRLPWHCMDMMDL